MSDVDDNIGNVIQGAVSRAALEYIVKSIVEDKEAVSIDFAWSADDTDATIVRRARASVYARAAAHRAAALSRTASSDQSASDRI